MRQRSIMKEMKEVLGEFDKTELLKLLTIDWLKVLSEAKQLCRRVNGCETCQKADTHYFFELKSHTEEKGNEKYVAFFCSTDCFTRWRMSGKEPHQLNYDEKDIYNKLLNILALCYLPQELVRARNFDFHLAVKNKIKNYERNSLCDYCHQNKKSGYSYMISKKSKAWQGNYCSKDCLMKQMEKVRATWS